MYFIQKWYLNKTEMSILFQFLKHDEILLTRTEVFMIIKKYYIINYVINEQSIWLFKNQ
jgi:hypothetical protein